MLPVGYNKFDENMWTPGKPVYVLFNNDRGNGQLVEVKQFTRFEVGTQVISNEYIGVVEGRMKKWNFHGLDYESHLLLPKQVKHSYLNVIYYNSTKSFGARIHETEWAAQDEAKLVLIQGHIVSVRAQQITALI